MKNKGEKSKIMYFKFEKARTGEQRRKLGVRHALQGGEQNGGPDVLDLKQRG